MQTLHTEKLYVILDMLNVGRQSVHELSGMLFFLLVSWWRQTIVNGLTEESFIPDLPPHIDFENEYDEIMDIDKRIHIKSLFMPSFYEPGCDNTADVIVHPLYFWPGQRIDLRCAMCRRAFTYNGQMKHWWFMPEKFVEQELADKQKLKNSPNWVRDLRIMNERNDNDNTRTSGAMPSDEKGTLYERPMTVFIQRNGLLMILQATSENEGFYRCLDRASRNTLNFVYYLIAMQPMFVYFKPNSDVTNDQIAGECPSTDGFPDANWKFRHVPPTFIRDAFGMCGQNWTYCIDWILSDKVMNETKSWNLHNRSPTDAELAAQFVNLKIYFQWSNWTPCGNGKTVRTREGHCYLKKIDPKRDIEQLSDKLFEKHDIFEWANRLKNRFKAVDEFSRVGIRLYSGIIAKVIALSAFRSYGLSKEFDDCYTVDSGLFSRDYAYAKDRWFDAVFAAFGIKTVDSMLEESDRLCVHYYRKPRTIDDDTPSNVLLGSHIIENQQCPV